MSYSPPFGPVPRRKCTASAASPLLPAIDLAGTSNLASCARARFSTSAHRARVLGPSSSQATASIAVEDSESSGPEDFGAQMHVTVFDKRTPKDRPEWSGVLCEYEHARARNQNLRAIATRRSILVFNIGGLMTMQAGDSDLSLDPSSEKGTAEAAQKRATAPTKEERQYHAGLHRLHLLFLIFRANLIDRAASSHSLQALMLSLVEPGHLLGSHTGPLAVGKLIESLQRSVDWFGRTFTLTPISADDDLDSYNVQAKVEVAMEKRRGHAELLVALFVAMLRAQGIPARFTSLLDPLPKEPWRRVVRILKTVDPKDLTQKERSIAADELLLQKSKKLHPLEEDPCIGGSASAPRFAEDMPSTSSDQGGRPEAARADKEKGEGQEMGKGKGSSKAEEAAKGTKKRGKKGEGAEGSKRAKTAKDKGGAAEDTGGGASGQPTNRGEDEFERELQMAMMATATAAEVKKISAALFGKKAKKPPPAWPDLGSKPAAGSSDPSCDVGNPGGCCTCWAEVYCGDSEPDIVDSSATRTSPIMYILAVQSGQVKDVTARYSSSMLTVQKVRDSQWWSETVSILEGVQGPAMDDSGRGKHVGDDGGTVEHQQKAGSLAEEARPGPSAPTGSSQGEG
eukprot:gene30865-35909_t